MSTRHVIVVDDGEAEFLKLKPRLRNLGYDVISVSDGSKDSVLKLADAQPEVAILDFVHNAKLGDDSTAARIEKVLNIPVLFVAPKTIAKGNLKKPTDEGYLLKPLDDLELKSSIELALKREGDSETSIPKIAGAASRKLVDLNAVATDSNLRRLKTNLKRDNSQKKGAAEALSEFKSLPIFEKLPEKSLLELAERSQFATVNVGDYIIFEGDKSERCFIMLSGRFAMTKTSVGGKELVVELLGPGDFFGLSLASDKLPSQLSAKAQAHSEILWIQTSALMKVLQDNPILYKGFLEDLSRRLHLSHNLSHGLAHDSVKVRIAALLLSLVVKFARAGRVASAPIIIDITRQQIADLTGTTPESAIRMTREMQSEGLINVGTPGVLRIVDLEALTALATT